MRFDPSGSLVAQLRAYDLHAHCPGKTTLLYRFHDQAGLLLYAGVTCNPAIRWQAHRKRAAWWSQVATFSVESHPYTNAALDAELAAIRTESPPYNLRSVPAPFRRDSGTAPDLPARSSRVVCIGNGMEGKRKGREGIEHGSPLGLWCLWLLLPFSVAERNARPPRRGTDVER